MKNLLSLSLISTKIALLLCFSFMGIEIGEAKHLQPCYEQIQTDSSQDDCDVCELSEKVWSEAFIGREDELIFQDRSQNEFVFEKYLFHKKQVQYSQTKNTGPPDDTKVLHSHLVAQRSILLLL